MRTRINVLNFFASVFTTIATTAVAAAELQPPPPTSELLVLVAFHEELSLGLLLNNLPTMKLRKVLKWNPSVRGRTM